MKRTICLACAFALVLMASTAGFARAASRCVANKRFVVLSGGLANDTLTKLEWQQQASTTIMTWALAKTYCPSGLRLPTVKELMSIVDLTVVVPDAGPTIDQTAFPDTPAECFWTSSPYAISSNYAWYVDFYSGASYAYDGGYSCRVRCVR